MSCSVEQCSLRVWECRAVQFECLAVQSGAVWGSAGLKVHVLPEAQLAAGVPGAAPQPLQLLAARCALGGQQPARQVLQLVRIARDVVHLHERLRVTSDSLGVKRTYTTFGFLNAFLFLTLAKTIGSLSKTAVSQFVSLAISKSHSLKFQVN